VYELEEMWWGPIHGTSLYGISKVVFFISVVMHIFINNIVDLLKVYFFCKPYGC
jgi:hypothetical protein